jgi:NCS1 family nucleobase:cation symporter-1
VQLMEKFTHRLLCLVALFILAVATLSTNLAANVVSPANDFSNLAPRWISFRTGGILTALIGVLMQPWRLYADPAGYIFVWLIGYSALLGPVAGIMIADYFIHRRQQLQVEELYEKNGRYSFSRGFSLVGLGSLLLAILPNLPGFLVAVQWMNPERAPAFLLSLYNYAWFVGFILGFVFYLSMRYLSFNLKNHRS